MARSSGTLEMWSECLGVGFRKELVGIGGAVGSPSQAPVIAYSRALPAGLAYGRDCHEKSVTT